MQTLFRIWTGDNGNGILKDALRSEPFCSRDADCKENCCVTSPVLAVMYFLSFTVIAQFILLNVVIAVLMAQLEESTADEERRADEDQAKAVNSGSPMRPDSMGSWTFTEPSMSRQRVGLERLGTADITKSAEQHPTIDMHAADHQTPKEQDAPIGSVVVEKAYT